jgi:hypothetical protein
VAHRPEAVLGRLTVGNAVTMVEQRDVRPARLRDALNATAIWR